MHQESHLTIIRGRLRKFAAELKETPGREQDARTVATLFAEFEGGEPQGRSLSIKALRDGLAAVSGADGVLEKVDDAIADGAE